MTQPLVNECIIGKYTFNIAINRKLAIDILEKYPDYWEMLQEVQSRQDEKGLSDFKTVIAGLKVMEKRNEVAEYALPLMLKLAKDNTKAGEIIKYSKEVKAIDALLNKISEFLLVGFTKGVAVETPTVEVKL